MHSASEAALRKGVRLRRSGCTAFLIAGDSTRALACHLHAGVKVSISSFTRFLSITHCAKVAPPIRIFFSCCSSGPVTNLCAIFVFSLSLWFVLLFMVHHGGTE